MTLLHAVVLGIVQGLTEFIPVSSSGHLIAVPELLGWDKQTLSFDVSVHMGTLVAVVAYFRRDWNSIISGFVRHIVNRVPYARAEAAAAGGSLMVPILVACVPAGIVGYAWNDFIENTLREWYWVAGALVVIGLVMLLAERVGKKERGLARMNYVDFVVIGCAQALALFPGVSRSGITISAGLFRNLDRAAAARFSFLMSSPIILGAGLKELKDALEEGVLMTQAPAVAVGFVSAAASGYIAIHFLMSYLANRGLGVFAYYRFALAAFLAVVFLMR